MAIETIDAALAEFATRNAVPAAIIIDPISEIDPLAAEQLTAVVSQIHDDPGVLHMRDALNILLDLRSVLAEKPEMEKVPA